MDGTRFDTITRALIAAGSRRGLLATGLSGVLGTLGGDRVEAKKKCPPCKKRKQGKCKKTLPDGTVCAGGTCQGGRCCIPNCAGKACGPDGCSNSCGSCASGSICARGQCVIGQGTCDAGEDHCLVRPPGANCGSGCLCFTTMEDNQTRCGNGEGLITCDPGCDTDADCEGQRPDVPGIFCAKDTGDFCACPPGLGPGFCVDPCPA